MLFFGFDRRLVAALHEAGILVLHQVGTVEQARQAAADGADVLIAQGREAGGCPTRRPSAGGGAASSRPWRRA